MMTFVILLLVAGCSNPRLALNAQCTKTDECSAGLVCLASRCAKLQCTSNSDCRDDEVCGIDASCQAKPAGNVGNGISIASVHGEFVDATVPGGYAVGSSLVIEGSGLTDVNKVFLLDAADMQSELLIFQSGEPTKVYLPNAILVRIKGGESAFKLRVVSP